MSKKVRLSDTANIFHEPYLGITICKGEVMELTLAQLSHKRVRSAINSGHLVVALEEERVNTAVNEQPKKSLEELFEKFTKLIEGKKSIKHISKQFSLGQLKDMALSLEFVLDEDETKESLIESMIEDIGDTGETK